MQLMTLLLRLKLLATYKMAQLFLKQWIPTVLCVLLCSTAFGQEDEPPKTRLEFIIDGQTISINEGDTIEIGSKKVIVNTARARRFQLDKLGFDYPRDFAYRYEAETTFKTWTLDGNNFVIVVFEFPVQIELEMFTGEMVKKFGKKNCKVSSRKLKLGSADLAGQRIDVKLLGTRLTFDVYEVPSQDTRMRVIAFQDTKTDSGEDSEEGTRTMALVAGSFTTE